MSESGVKSQHYFKSCTIYSLLSEFDNNAKNWVGPIDPITHSLLLLLYFLTQIILNIQKNLCQELFF